MSYKFNGGYYDLNLGHWYDIIDLTIYPIYNIKYNILMDWFKPFNVRSKADQKAIGDFMYSGSMLGRKDYYIFDREGNNLNEMFSLLESDLIFCAQTVWDKYSSLDKAYINAVFPILNGDKEMWGYGSDIDWMFRYPALCKIVAPENYSKMKSMARKQADYLYSRNEPNILRYYDRWDEIFDYLDQYKF